jgi:ATP-dependent DNA ligase
MSDDDDSMHMPALIKSMLDPCVNVMGPRTGSPAKREIETTLLPEIFRPTELQLTAIGEVTVVEGARLQLPIKLLIRKTQPYAKKIAHPGIWVEPSVLAEIEYRAKSAEGKVRHPLFKGLREDLDGYLRRRRMD